ILLSLPFLFISEIISNLNDAVILLIAYPVAIVIGFAIVKIPTSVTLDDTSIRWRHLVGEHSIEFSQISYVTYEYYRVKRKYRYEDRIKLIIYLSDRKVELNDQAVRRDRGRDNFLEELLPREMQLQPPIIQIHDIICEKCGFGDET
ncbi:MAG: hypothetical protein ACI4Q6_10180, partial [Huintestinicola sp.]